MSTLDLRSRQLVRQQERYRTDPVFRAERLAHNRAYVRSEAGKLARAASRRRQKYGIDRQDYEAMLAAQEGACVCGSKKPGGRAGTYFMVDHNHKTGEIRGLLCHLCNSAIGYAKDDPTRLRLLADYLDQKKHEPAAKPR